MPDSIGTNLAQSATGDGRTSIEQLQQRSKIPKGVKIMKKGDNNLSRDSFLKLLLTKLSHQDPIKPVEDQAFIAQMAQFSALEQMNNVSSELKSLKRLQANQLIGKFVSGKDFVHKKEILSGQVTSVFHDNTGSVFLSVNGKRMRLEDVMSISQAPAPSNQVPVNVSRETNTTPKPEPTILKNLQNYTRQQVAPQTNVETNANIHTEQVEPDSIKNKELTQKQKGN